jgi:proliferating cell nuclear antigen PCNA
MSLAAENFEVFELNNTQRFVAGINMNSLWKLIKSTSTHDTITFCAEMEHQNQLIIIINNADKNSQSRFRLNLLECDEEEITLPDVTFDCTFTLPSLFLQRLVRDMSHIGETLTVVCDGKTIILKTDGDFASQETCIGEAEDGMSSLTVNQMQDNGGITGKYSLKYLTLF